jgi:hypothetical protein
MHDFDMESDKVSHTKSEILEDLEYWRKKLAHFENTKNENGIKVAKLLINKYLDAYNDAII